MSAASDPVSVIRGHGLLKPLLARLRARQANRFIPPALRAGRALDIGCGSFPYFLSQTEFRDKYAVDQLPPAEQRTDIHWHTLDLNATPQLPFADEYFSVVTLLAVTEHLNPTSLVELFSALRRVLRPDGLLIITTPASWSDPLLRFLARVGLVSKEEIDEHVYAYSLPLLGWYFGRAGFAMQNLRFGYFEFGLNLWAVAKK